MEQEARLVMKTSFAEILTALSVIGFVVSLFAAYITHLVWSVISAMNASLDTVSEWFLVFAGLFFPPIGIVHGFVIWFM